VGYKKKWWHSLELSYNNNNLGQRSPDERGQHIEYRTAADKECDDISHQKSWGRGKKAEGYT